MLVPNGGPGLFFWNTERQREDKCQCLGLSVLFACVHMNNMCHLYLCSREVMPAAVSEVGRGDVRVLFPKQPLGPHAPVAGL